jgi:hypothetical protein
MNARAKPLAKIIETAVTRLRKAELMREFIGPMETADEVDAISREIAREVRDWWDDVHNKSARSRLAA